MKRNTLNKCEDFTFEDRLMNITSNDGLYKKGSPRIKPLAVALSIVLAGLAFSSQVEAVGYPSPWIVPATSTKDLQGDNQINTNYPTESAIAIIYGTVTFSDSTAAGQNNNMLYSNKLGLPFSSDNSITVYGNLLGNGNNPNSLLGAFNTNSDPSNITTLSNNNTVIFKAGSHVENVHVYGAKIDNRTGLTPSDNTASVNSNTVIIEKGSDYTGVNKYLVGGYAIANNTATASNNKIIIGAGKLEGPDAAIIAGWTSTSNTDQQATMSDNEVYLYGDADVSDVAIYGALRTKPNQRDYIINSPTTTVMTGNTLIFGYNNIPWAPTNYTIKSVNNFSTIRMDALTWGKTITINSLSNKSTDSTETKIDATNISFSGVNRLNPGDSYDLLTVSSVTDGSSVGLTSESSEFYVGTSLQGTGKVTQSGNTFSYTVGSLELQPQTHNAAMASSASAVALSDGANTLSESSYNLSNSGVTGVQAFSSVGGGASRVKTGSHVNVQSLNFSVGVGNNIQNDYGLLSVGAAFEAGFGKFRNHFNAGKADPYIKKNGDISYYGIAALSNMNFENLWHINGALRYGRVKTSQNRALYNMSTGQAYDLDLSSYYIGAELGGGKVIKINDLDSLDLYGRYFFLHQDGNSFNASGKYELSSVNSHRLRLAGRYSHNYSPTTALYTGLGAEYEFDGKSELKVDGIWVKPSKTDGFRGFGEIGVKIKPASNKGLILDLGIKGLLGDGFRGAWANAEIKYLF